MSKLLFAMLLVAASVAIVNPTQAQRKCVQDCVAAIGTCQLPCSKSPFENAMY